MLHNLKHFLDDCVQKYNHPAFIYNDPIQIPHRFTLLQDIEITAFWTAILAWGQRKTIINKASELFALMDNTPYDFIVHHQESDRKRFLNFKHRTFQTTDTLYFLEFFQQFYQSHHSLEEAFIQQPYPTSHILHPTSLMEPPIAIYVPIPKINLNKDTQTAPFPTYAKNTEQVLINFHNQFFSLPNPPHRTRKHIANPATKSTCKRLNMFLRWMVRKDQQGVDFGLWNKITPAQLLMPLDVHVERQARRLGLIQRKQTDWLTVIELTENLKAFDPLDPVKYDYALFGLGVMEKAFPMSFL